MVVNVPAQQSQLPHSGTSHLLSRQTSIVGAQVGGEFKLPGDQKQELAFIAGVTGITPFCEWEELTRT